jgi:hypothetical protein
MREREARTCSAVLMSSIFSRSLSLSASLNELLSLTQQYLLQENMKKDDKKSEALILKWLFPLSLSPLLLTCMLSHSASLVCGSFFTSSSFFY